VVASAPNKNTPRAVKRFLNAVRYYAMLQAPEPTLHLKTKVEGTAVSATTNGRIDEPDLVIMASGWELDQLWPQHDDPRKSLRAVLDRQLKEWARLEPGGNEDGADHAAVSENVQSAVRKIASASKRIDTLTEDDITRFQQLIKGVAIAASDGALTGAPVQSSSAA
jgi:hypothetical protein